MRCSYLIGIFYSSFLSSCDDGMKSMHFELLNGELFLKGE
jgi:hypothetical protein